MPRIRNLGILGVCVALLPGCSVMQTMSQGTKSLVKDLKPESFDEEHAPDNPGDPWIAAAASEGRFDHKPEVANDPLRLRQYFMSNKARAIENNLGISEFE